MSQVYFRFYAELNDHLPVEKRMVPFAHILDHCLPVKDMIEALGVPTGEVDLILVNGESVDLSYVVKDGDIVSLYPVFESFDIISVARVRSLPLRQTRFVLDVHLGKLAAYLRMLGFDTLYRNDYTDEDLVSTSNSEGRILLSKDRKLLQRSTLTRLYCVNANDPKGQLVEVLRRFDLFKSTVPFQRCLRCNSVLQPVRKEIIVSRVPPKVSQFYDEFQVCRACDRIYWKGGHYDRMQSFIDSVLQQMNAT